jgi:hypothetical protein
MIFPNWENHFNPIDKETCTADIEAGLLSAGMSGQACHKYRLVNEVFCA